MELMNMETVVTKADLRARVQAAKARGAVVGFVPTMGYLHAGHARLMEQARRECDYVVVSIFVNPLQFGPNEDLARYPRDLPRDQAICESVGVDLLFAPDVAEMYPDGSSLTFVEVTGLTKGLCGAARPGHFRGVTTVVAKLFNLVMPDVAYFGQKDAQQVRVIQQMVADLQFPVEIRVVPTVREPDGLAMSSRNTYLSPQERQAALVLSRTLSTAVAALEQGERDAHRLRAQMQRQIAEEPLARLDYAEVVSWRTLEPVDAIGGETLIALAVYIGTTRLIDNVLWQPKSDRGDMK